MQPTIHAHISDTCVLLSNILSGSYLQNQTGWSCSGGQLFIVGFLHFKNIEKKL
jgi:hypothetical protein